MATLYRIKPEHDYVMAVAMPVEPEDPSAGFQLEELYRMLDCTTVEVLNLHDGRILIVDEEGTFKSPPVLNPIPSELYRLAGGGQPVVGSALLCTEGEFH